MHFFFHDGTSIQDNNARINWAHIVHEVQIESPLGIFGMCWRTLCAVHSPINNRMEINLLTLQKLFDILLQLLLKPKALQLNVIVHEFSFWSGSVYTEVKQMLFWDVNLGPDATPVENHF